MINCFISDKQGLTLENLFMTMKLRDICYKFKNRIKKQILSQEKIL